MDDNVYRGLIIRQKNYGDAHRMLWIFTETAGIIKAVRYGIRGRKASDAAAFQTLCYGDIRLRPSRGDIMTALGAEIIEAFPPVAEDIAKLALVNYFCDITHELVGEDNPDSRALSLLLNIIYAAAYRNEPLEKLRCTFEFKLVCAEGYMPDTSGCEICGAAPGYFGPDRGAFTCGVHRRADDMAVTPEQTAIMRYLASCPDKRMTAFSASDETVYGSLCAVTERCVAAIADRSFRSLDYYKMIRG